jgi:hypothetical protein
MSDNIVEAQNNAYEELAKCNETFRYLQDIDNFIITNYNIKEYFYANDIYSDPIIKYEKLTGSNKRDEQYDTKSRYFIYSKNSLLLIFPMVGSMIHCTLQFAENIDVIKNMLSVRFNDKVFELNYSEKKFKSNEQYIIHNRTGAKIIISYSPLEMFTHIKNNRTLLEMIQQALY